LWPLSKKGSNSRSSRAKRWRDSDTARALDPATPEVNPNFALFKNLTLEVISFLSLLFFLLSLLFLVLFLFLLSFAALLTKPVM
jgi:hypothetical protein